MYKTLPAIALCLTALVGCETLAALKNNERAQLQMTQTTFTRVVQELTILRAEGKFKAADADRITLAIKRGNELLDKWCAAVENPVENKVIDVKMIISEITMLISDLRSLKQEAK